MLHARENTRRATPGLRLGELLLHNQLATTRTVEEGLALQQRVRRLGFTLELGRILVRTEKLAGSMRDAVLALQHRISEKGMRTRDGAERDEAEPTSFGRLALHNGMLRWEQVQAALRIQRVMRARGVARRVGEVLVREGVLTERDREAILCIQDGKRRGTCAAEPIPEVSGRPVRTNDLFFGRIAVRHGYMTQLQLEAALLEQRLGRTEGENWQLGEILRGQKLLTREQLTRILTLQDGLVDGYLRRAPQPTGWWFLVPEHALGDLLNQRAVVSRGEVKESVRLQRILHRLGVRIRLGEVLQTRTQITDAVLHAVLDEQILRREQDRPAVGLTARTRFWLGRLMAW